MYFSSGLPNNHRVLEETEMVLTPKFISVSPSHGSIAGSIIHARIEGLGVENSGFTLVDQAGNDICETAYLVSSATLECKTIAGKQIAAGT